MNNNANGAQSATAAHPDSRNLSETTCLVSSKFTGVASVVFQVITLVCSGLIVLYFYYQIGGLETFGFAANSTLLHRLQSETDILPEAILRGSGEVDEVEDSLFPTNHTAEIRGVFDNLTDIISVDPENVTFNVKGMVELDVVELIRLSTLVYFGMCAAWAASIFLLCASIRYETLDLIVINAFILTVAVLYQLVHALFILILVYFQFMSNLGWRSMAVVLCSTVALLILMCFGIFSLALLVGWYRYVAYMNSESRCLCIGAVARCFKRTKRAAPEQEYAMPEVTRTPAYHAPVDDRQIRDFDAI